MIDRQDAGHRPADAVAPVHIVRAEAVCQQVQKRHPQQDHGGHHVEHGIQAVSGAPHGGVQHKKGGKQDVGRHDTLEIPGAGGDDCRVRGENAGEGVGLPHHQGGAEQRPADGQGHGDPHPLPGPVLPAGADILAHEGDDGGSHALGGQEGQGIQLVAHVEPGGIGLAEGVDFGEDAHGPQGHQGHLDAAGQADADDLPEQLPVKAAVEGVDGQLGIMAVDIPDAEEPAACLGNDGAQGHAQHPQGAAQHQRKVQDDV